MSKILYRKNQSIKIEGYEVEDANRHLVFEQMLDTFKITMYNAAHKFDNILDLEAAFAAGWLYNQLEENGKAERVEILDMPNLLEFQLPREFYLVPDNITWVAETINPVAKESQTYVRKTINIIVKANPDFGVVYKTNTFPETLLKDFGYVISKGVTLNALVLFMQQHWYYKYKVIFKCSLQDILDQVKLQANLKVHSAPSTLKGQKVYTLSRGRMTETFGYVLPNSVLKEIASEIVPLEFTVASNSPEITGLTVDPIKGKVVGEYILIDFLQFLYKKIRPYGTGNATLPFDINGLGLLSSFLWETRQEVPHPNIRNILDRSALVTMVNEYHAYKYSEFLNDRTNTEALAAQFFECTKHWSSGDKYIKAGLKLKNKVIPSSAPQPKAQFEI